MKEHNLIARKKIWTAATRGTEFGEKMGVVETGKGGGVNSSFCDDVEVEQKNEKKRNLEFIMRAGGLDANGFTNRFFIFNEIPAFLEKKVLVFCLNRGWLVGPFFSLLS